jgi:hypothetical protein
MVDGFTTKIACPTRSFRVRVYPSGVDVSTSTLRYLSACLRTRRRAAGTHRQDALYADRGYDHDRYRKQVCEARIKPVIARRGEQHDSGLGVYRWVVQQGFALLHWLRRLRIRWEIRDDIHEAFLRFACASSAEDTSTTSQTVRSSKSVVADLVVGGVHPFGHQYRSRASRGVRVSTAHLWPATPSATMTTSTTSALIGVDLLRQRARE